MSKKILIAEDDLAILEALTMILEDEGYKVQATSDGQTVRNIQKEYPDLIILDLWMSGWDGGAICLYLKRQETTRHIPIIIISANKDTKNIAQKAGADDFIAKPFDIDELIAKVAWHIV